MIFPPLPMHFRWVGRSICYETETLEGIPFQKMVVTVHPDGELFLAFMNALLEMGIEQGQRSTPNPEK